MFSSISKRLATWLAVFALGLLAVSVTACGGGESATKPAILTQPKDANVSLGTKAQFSVTASGDPIKYQWYKNGKPVSGATTRVFTTDPVTTIDNAASVTVVLSNDLGSVISSPAILTVGFVSSADQDLFDKYSLKPGQAFSVLWSLPATGTPSLSSFIASSSAGYDMSALNGPQVLSISSVGLLSKNSNSAITIAPTRHLVNGIIVLSGAQQVNFVNGGVRVDTLAQDGKTVLASQSRTDLVNEPLTGRVVDAPANLAKGLGAVFFNKSVLSQSATWGPDAAYLEYTATNLEDRYTVQDWTGNTSGTQVNPVATGTSLVALLNAGITGSDGITYDATIGTVSLVGSVPMFVANALRARSTTPTYQCFFELAGNIYSAYLVKAGTVLGGTAYPTGATALDFSFTRQVRLNRAAHTSLQQALTF